MKPLLSTDEIPDNPENYPKNEFERDVIKAIVSRKTYYEKVKEDNDNYYLMEATSVSAVTTCRQKSRRSIIGAISYKISLNKYFRD